MMMPFFVSLRPIVSILGLLYKFATAIVVVFVTGFHDGCVAGDYHAGLPLHGGGLAASLLPRDVHAVWRVLQRTRIVRMN